MTKLVKGSFYSSDESQRQSRVQESKDPQQSSNGFYQNFLRLDLLTRTTKGVFQDIVPDEQLLKSLTENFHKEQGAVPVRIADPSKNINATYLEGFLTYDIVNEEHGGITDKAWQQRKKALYYAHPTHKRRN